MDHKNEIKNANRKAMPKFLLLVAVGALIGGVTGFCSARYGVKTLADGLEQAGAFFGAYIAPWVMIVMAVLLPMICTPIYQKAAKQLAGWDGENEEISDAVDRQLSIVLWVTGAATTLSFFLIAATYSGGFENLDQPISIISFFAGILGLFAIMIETVVFQQKCVDTTKKMNPEKTASVYDTKFQKKWVDSCDEAEKLVIGKCAFKAYSSTNTTCAVLAIVLAVAALLFPIGFLPSLVVCLIWFVNQSVYCKEALKYAKAGNKIS